MIKIEELKAGDELLRSWGSEIDGTFDFDFVKIKKVNKITYKLESETLLYKNSLGVREVRSRWGYERSTVEYDFNTEENLNKLRKIKEESRIEKKRRVKGRYRETIKGWNIKLLREVLDENKNN